MSLHLHVYLMFLFNSFSSVSFVPFQLVCFCFILFYYFSLEDCFLRRDRESVDSNGGEGEGTTGEVKGGKTQIRIYCMKNLF